MAGIRAASPNIVILGDNSVKELSYVENDYNNRLNVELRSASLSWLLTQVGSTLTSAVDANSAVFRVAAVSKSGMTLFAAGDVLVVDNELLKITAVNGLDLTVKRGTAMGTPATPHAARTRIAAVCSSWPGALTMDVTAGCPLADVGYGPERWVDWDARRAQTMLHSADYDGIAIDCMAANISWFIKPGYGGNPPIRSIDENRSNTIPTSYTALDAAWAAGTAAYAEEVRRLLGPDPIIVGNNAANATTELNGANFEGFPQDGATQAKWQDAILGPRAAPDASYLQWSAGRQPSLVNLETYESDGWLSPNPFGTSGWHPNYRKMRFGLTSALMGDGTFSYEMASNGHGRLGLMWFDEYDNAGAGKGYLGQALGSAHLAQAPLSTSDLVVGDGAFTTAAQSARWTLSPLSGYAATMVQDAGAERIDVSSSAGKEWGVYFSHHSGAVTAGKSYTLTFRAKASRPLKPMTATIVTATPRSTWVDYGAVTLGTEWRTFEMSGVSAGTDTSPLFRFSLGASTGAIWLDDVKVQEGDRIGVYRRDFTGGIALVNSKSKTVTVSLGGTFCKIDGTQAPTVNDGSLVTAVTIPPKDGLVLLRPGPAAAPPAIASADFTNPVAYGIASLQTTRMRFACDTPGVHAKLVVHVPGGDWTVFNSKVANTAGAAYLLSAWNGKNPATGKPAPYAANYGWTLTVTKNGQTATKTGNLLLCTIYLRAQGVSAGNQAVRADCYFEGSRTTPRGVNFYVSARSSSGAGSIALRITGPGGYSAVPSSVPWRLPVPAPAPRTPNVSGRSGIRANGVYSIYSKGTTNVTYMVSVIE